MPKQKKPRKGFPYRNQPSILIREGAEEIYKHIRRIERENKHSGRKINN